MNYSRGFQLGLKSYSEAFSFIFKNGLGWFFIFPFLLNVLFFFVGFYSIASWGDVLVSDLSDWMGVEEWDFWGASVLAGSIKWIVWIVLRLLFFIVYAYVGGYIILIVMSPVFAFLSEKTERIITQSDIPFNMAQFVKDIWRGMILAMRNLVVEMFFTVILFVLSFIPIIGYFTAIVLVLLSAYFYGFSFLDYTFERRRFDVKTSVKYMRRNRGLAIGNGLVFALILMIPLIGVSIAGFMSIVSVVAATIAARKALEEEKVLG
ncbi:EI24 domain-containing protein [Carboxylicivirga sp. N1Y90]|uniref:EI24 domain-containing protein n=1 Tax=Carboxylicivirga fragile TaxID=3417571 RepID=UPI003D3377DF|nr:EI24 domain-containing protein [Marinilabiliaceae bacterium N1Y90]